MTLGTEKANTNFAAAKELCRTGHPGTDGRGCTYGGSPADGYWLVDDDCPFDHGDVCDLRTHCNGAPTEACFTGYEPDPEIGYWFWRVTACTPCADAYAEAHPDQGEKS